jgi:ABC-type transporter Mla subunit MlaD
MPYLNSAGSLPPPDLIDRHGPAWRADKINGCVAFLAERSGTYFQHRSKKMTADLDRATELVDEANARFGARMNALIERENNFAAAAKKASGQVRDATQKMAEGLTKIEKTANFDRLERYVELLERAEKSLSVLAELDKTGRLERIAAALK